MTFVDIGGESEGGSCKRKEETQYFIKDCSYLQDLLLSDNLTLQRRKVLVKLITW